MPQADDDRELDRIFDRSYDDYQRRGYLLPAYGGQPWEWWGKFAGGADFYVDWSDLPEVYG